MSQQKGEAPVREIIVGTAGHIDHGKTALVEALTGINTDRLKEERLRGITIELGFAHLTLPSGLLVGIVDVPGHERFVKTMVAGATGIDVVILVVAADEGVMPQTREHLDICRLLRVKRGVVALTKVDLVEEEWLQLVEEDLRDFLSGTFLEGAPLVRTSAVTGQGLEELVDQLDALCQGLEPRPTARFFRLPVDRVFSIRGFGTVVTGTLIQGRISEGDPVVIAPKGLRSRVRGVQVHNQAVSQSFAGTRTAVNLQAVEKEEVERGDVLIPPDSFLATHMVDVQLEYLPHAGRPLKNRTRVRFHSGTSEILARVVLLDRDELEPGADAPAQLRLERPTVAIHGDPFVIRSYSPIRTVGGGVVLDGLPRKHRRPSFAQVVRRLQAMGSGDIVRVVLQMIEGARLEGLSLLDLDRRLNLSPERWKEILGDARFLHGVVSMGNEGGASREDLLFVSKERFQGLAREIMEQVEAYHASHPLEPGVPRDDLRGRCPSRPSPRVFAFALQTLQKEGLLDVEGDRWRRKDHRIELGEDERHHLEEMDRIFRKAGLQPPSLKAVGEELGLEEKQVKDLADFLVRQGRLNKVKEGLYFPSEELERLKERMVLFLKEKGEIVPLDFKEMTGLSRKYMIPLLEYFDRIRLTMRVGDKRVLRRE